MNSLRFSACFTLLLLTSVTASDSAASQGTFKVEDLKAVVARDVQFWSNYVVTPREGRAALIASHFAPHARFCASGFESCFSIEELEANLDPMVAGMQDMIISSHDLMFGLNQVSYTWMGAFSCNGHVFGARGLMHLTMQQHNDQVAQYSFGYDVPQLANIFSQCAGGPPLDSDAGLSLSRAQLVDYVERTVRLWNVALSSRDSDLSELETLFARDIKFCSLLTGECTPGVERLKHTFKTWRHLINGIDFRRSGDIFVGINQAIFNWEAAYIAENDAIYEMHGKIVIYVNPETGKIERIDDLYDRPSFEEWLHIALGHKTLHFTGSKKKERVRHARVRDEL